MFECRKNCSRYFAHSSYGYNRTCRLPVSKRCIALIRAGVIDGDAMMSFFGSLSEWKNQGNLMIDPPRTDNKGDHLNEPRKSRPQKMAPLDRLKGSVELYDRSLHRTTPTRSFFWWVGACWYVRANCSMEIWDTFVYEHERAVFDLLHHFMVLNNQEIPNVLCSVKHWSSCELHLYRRPGIRMGARWLAKAGFSHASLARNQRLLGWGKN